MIQLQNEGQNPSYDPDGSRLRSILNAAAAIWEDQLPGDGEYEIDVFYDNLPNGTLGEWSFQLGGDNNLRIDPTPRTSNGGFRNWFIDPTPLTHSEFNLTGVDFEGATFYKDLTNSQQNNFEGSPPGLMEVGFAGTLNSGLASAQFSAGDESTAVDMLSVALHELGHELGIESSSLETSWDVQPAWVGNARGVEINALSGDHGHIAAPTALMSATLSQGLRRLPSAIDVFAVADDEGFSTVDLDRKYALNSGNWNNALEWLGGRVPSDDDHAILVSGGTLELAPVVLQGVPLDPDGSARDLTLGQSSRLQLNGHNLTVTQQTTIAAGSALEIPTGSVAALNDFEHEGTLLMQGGTLRINGTANHNAVSTQVGAGVRGRGTIQLAGRLNNNRNIEALDGTLTITNAGNGSIDADGTLASGENGKFIAATGSIKVNAPLAERFDGNINVGAGQHFSTAYDWQFGNDSVVTLKGSATQRARLTTADIASLGVTHEYLNTIVVDGRAEVSPQVSRFLSTARIELPDAADTLYLDSALNTEWANPKFVGTGTIVQEGDIQVIRSTTLDNVTFDWGNSSADDIHTLKIDSGYALTINSPSLGSANNTYSGRLEVQGTLTVNTPTRWNVPANSATEVNSMHLTGTDAFNPPTINGTSNLDISSPVYINAPVGRLASESTRFLSGSKVVFERNGDLSTRNNTIVVDAELDHRNFNVGMTTNGAGTWTWGTLGRTIVRGANNGSLLLSMLSGAQVDLQRGGHVFEVTPGAQLIVNSAVDPFTDSVTATQHARIENNSSRGLRFESGDVTVTSILGTGATTILPNAKLSLNRHDQTQVTNQGEVTLIGESPSITAEQYLNEGVLNVVSSSFVDGTFTHRGEVALSSAEPSISFVGTLKGGGDFTGPGVVRINAAYSPGDDGVTLAPAVVTFDSHLTLVSTSIYQPLILDSTAGMYDQLSVAGDVLLLGALDLNYQAPVPSAVGLEYDLITAGSIAGAFTSFDSPKLVVNNVPTDIFDLRYDANRVYLVSMLSYESGLGDFDGDSQLTVADIDLLATSIRRGAADTRFDLNGDRQVSSADHSYWVQSIYRTYFGDANLDKVFDTLDLITVFQAGEYEDRVNGNSTWREGDWDGDGDFTSNDIITAFSDGGYERGARRAVPAMVPEPSGYAVSALLTLFGLWSQRRRPNGSNR